MRKYIAPLLNAIKNPTRIVNNKIYFLIIFFTIFSLIYLLLDDNNFTGVNKYKEIVREEVIKNIAEKKTPENFENENKEKSILMPYSRITDLYKIYKTEEVLDKANEEAKEEVLEEDIAIENVEPTLIQRLYNRMYFSINTGCLLGYGDIYPQSNLCKLIAMIQALSTIALILS